MITLKEALALTSQDNDDVVCLKSNNVKEIILVSDIKKKYDLKRVKVININPWFLNGDYTGFQFLIL